MKPLTPEIDGIRQYDRCGERTDTVTPILGEGESLVVLTHDEKVLLAAALSIAASSRHSGVSAARDYDPDFVGSKLDVINTRIAEDFTDMGAQIEAMLPSDENPIDQAIELQLHALEIHAS